MKAKNIYIVSFEGMWQTLYECEFGRWFISYTDQDKKGCVSQLHEAEARQLIDEAQKQR